MSVYSLVHHSPQCRASEGGSKYSWAKLVRDQHSALLPRKFLFYFTWRCMNGLVVKLLGRKAVGGFPFSCIDTGINSVLAFVDVDF